MLNAGSKGFTRYAWQSSLKGASSVVPKNNVIILTTVTKSINWSWKSGKTFGHAFKTHQAGAKNLKALVGRANSPSVSPIQGQWLNNEKLLCF
ncbi:hypothetical protein T190115A13A_60097 [Tenacibaculum sp. 190524A02b]|uniref:Uncharacterized protein n=1 Tax=Tenacibaculum vairaonense TaxID=3137860 RepID=A0ABM9PQR0_9FLAO